MSAPSDDEYSESTVRAYVSGKRRKRRPSNGPTVLKTSSTPLSPILLTTSPETAPSSADVHQDRRTTSEFNSWCKPMREPPPRRWKDVLMIRNSLVFIFAVLV